MRSVDHIVAGSGIAGLTAARLLSLAGRSVLLAEKAPRIGGSLQRFRRDGLPFDTGFHFTGGLAPGGVLDDMLRALRLRDAIRPIFANPACAHRFVFEAEQTTFDMPCGIDRIRDRLQTLFPSEKSAVQRYFDRMRHVCAGSSAVKLQALALSPQRIEDDYISLRAVLDELTDHRLLKAILSAFCMCYGSAPQEVSFADHSRMCFAMYESVARVGGGGDAFIQAFRRAFHSTSVETATRTWIEACLDIEDDKARRFRLNTGEEIAARSGILTLHPAEILRLLPPSHVRPAFAERIADFEPTCGFFSLFAEGALEDDHRASDPIVSLFPSADLDALMSPDHVGDSALVILRSRENGTAGPARLAVSGLEVASLKTVAPWRDSRPGNRPPDYETYKQGRIERMRERMGAYSADYRDRLRVLDDASPLTFRDWLLSPDGSAYGIRQKVGQFNVCGKLPLRNLYAAGQSAVLPGLVGAMMSAFMTCRAVLGRETFQTLLDGRRPRP
jgi:all-trans-retinol 13,14-reductase